MPCASAGLGLLLERVVRRRLGRRRKMADMDRRRILQGALGMGALGTLAGPRAALAGEGNHAYRWDIVNNLGPCTEPGGKASSKSRDGARITVTGSGTFRDNPGNSQDV